MLTFFRANIASCLATLLDFLVTMLAFRMLHAGAVLSGVAGSMAGGLLHFSLNRTFVFKASEGRLDGQMVRYLLIWGINILLNMLGVYVFAVKLGWHYLFSKVLSSLCVFVGFNYPMHKKFVFKR